MVRDIESAGCARDTAAETQATDVEITSGGEFEGGEREAVERGKARDKEKAGKGDMEWMG